MKKQFSKFQIASFKRTAQNVYPLVRERNKLINILKETAEKLESIKLQLEAYQAPIKAATGGYTTDDLIEREVIDTGKLDKNGNAIKQTVFRLKYPETIIPQDIAVNGTVENTETIAVEMPSEGNDVDADAVTTEPASPEFMDPIEMDVL